MNTGETFPAVNIPNFLSYISAVRAKKIKEWAEAKENADALESIYAGIRNATSFTQLFYYSQTPSYYHASNGEVYLAKYRLRPTSDAVDTLIDREMYQKHYLGMDTVERQPGDTRSPTYLRDEFRQRVSNGGPQKVRYNFEVALHPIDAKSLNATINPLSIWDKKKYPFKHLGTVTIDEIFKTEDYGNLQVHFNPGITHASLPIPRAVSQYDSAAILHTRIVVYDRVKKIVKGGQRFLKFLTGLLGVGGVFAAVKVSESFK